MTAWQSDLCSPRNERTYQVLGEERGAVVVLRGRGGIVEQRRGGGLQQLIVLVLLEHVLVVLLQVVVGREEGRERRIVHRRHAPDRTLHATTEIQWTQHVLADSDASGHVFVYGIRT